jgi:hypothetical protein
VEGGGVAALRHGQQLGGDLLEKGAQRAGGGCRGCGGIGGRNLRSVWDGGPSRVKRPGRWAPFSCSPTGRTRTGRLVAHMRCPQSRPPACRWRRRRAWQCGYCPSVPPSRPAWFDCWLVGWVGGWVGWSGGLVGWVGGRVYLCMACRARRSTPSPKGSPPHVNDRGQVVPRDERGELGVAAVVEELKGAADGPGGGVPDVGVGVLHGLGFGGFGGVLGGSGGFWGLGGGGSKGLGASRKAGAPAFMERRRPRAAQLPTTTGCKGQNMAAAWGWRIEGVAKRRPGGEAGARAPPAAGRGAPAARASPGSRATGPPPRIQTQRSRPPATASPRGRPAC